MRLVRAVHGGDLAALAAAAGRDAAHVVDFSANLNPLGPPPVVARVLRDVATHPEILAQYPDPAYGEVRTALARRHGVDPERIAIANGSAALLAAIVRAYRPERCVLPVPAFSEYAKALHDAGSEARAVPLAANTYRIDAAATLGVARDERAALCLLANPNNPTGALTPRADILALSGELARISCTLVVDEAFVDYVPDESAIEPEERSGAPIVVRSLTKFFAIPGVRIGYAVAPRAVARRIADGLPSWPVGLVESRIAVALCSEPEFEATTRARNAIERERFRDGLRALGLRVFDGAANFVFADVSALSTDAPHFTRRLLREWGIAVRSCHDYRGLADPVFVRIAVRSRHDNELLLAAVAGSDFGADREAEPRTHHPTAEE